MKSNQIEAYLNRLLEENIPIYQLNRTSSDEVTFQVTYKDLHILKRYRKKYQCNIKFTKGTGFPKFYERRKMLIPVFISIGISLMLIFCLSNLIWTVTIHGGSQESRYEVKELIDSLGLKEGKWLQQAESISTIEREIMNTVEEISYVGIERQGTAYYIQIEESEEELDNPTDEPSHLVATKSGTIQSVYITDGRPLIGINDVVNKGDLLVSGFLDEDEEVLTQSKGEVWAEVWYHLDVRIDLQKEALMLLPDPETGYSLHFGDRALWKDEKDMRLLYEEEKPFYFFKWKLPIYLTKKMYHDEEPSTLEIEWDNHLDEIVEERLKRELGQSIELQYQKVLHEDIDSDKVELEMFVKVLEEISTQQIINQGD